MAAKVGARKHYSEALKEQLHRVELDRLSRGVQGVKHLVEAIEATVLKRPGSSGGGEGEPHPDEHDYDLAITQAEAVGADAKVGGGSEGEEVAKERVHEDHPTSIGNRVPVTADNMNEHLGHLRDSLEVVESVIKMQLDLMTSRERSLALGKQVSRALC